MLSNSVLVSILKISQFEYTTILIKGKLVKKFYYFSKSVQKVFVSLAFHFFVDQNISLKVESERRGGRIGEKSVVLILRKNRPVQHTFKI
jgi:hypothetical protein